MEQATVAGFTTLQEYGLAGLFLSLLMLGAIYMLRYFMNDCQKRHESTMEAYKKEAILTREIVDKNTQAFINLQTSLVTMQVTLTNMQNTFNRVEDKVKC